MAQNYIQPGKRFSYTVPESTTITAGSVVVQGMLAGVALSDGTEGDVIEVALEGVFNLPKTTGAGITQGDPLYWNSTTNKVIKTTGTSYANKPIGVAFETKESADTEIDVLVSIPSNYAVPVSQLDNGAATNGQVIKSNGTVWAPAADAIE